MTIESRPGPPNTVDAPLVLLVNASFPPRARKHILLAVFVVASLLLVRTRIVLPAGQHACGFVAQSMSSTRTGALAAVTASLTVPGTSAGDSPSAGGAVPQANGNARSASMARTPEGRTVF